MPTIKHPDLARLMAVADGMDAVIPADIDTDDPERVARAVQELLGSLVDVSSLMALVAARTDPIVDMVPELILLHPKASLASVWMDGFTLGVLYQQRGGHVGERTS